jgi:phage gp16-like protein
MRAARTTSPTDQRRRDLAKIHIAAKELHLTEDAYRTLLDSVAGVRSAAELDAAGRQEVLACLRRLGWEPRGSSQPQRARGPAGPQAAKIAALWGALHRAGKVRHGDARAMRRFVVRMTGVEALEWLTARQANLVIEALKAWLARGKA